MFYFSYIESYYIDEKKSLTNLISMRDGKKIGNRVYVGDFEETEVSCTFEETILRSRMSNPRIRISIDKIKNIIQWRIQIGAYHFFFLIMIFIFYLFSAIYLIFNGLLGHLFVFSILLLGGIFFLNLLFLNDKKNIDDDIKKEFDLKRKISSNKSFRIRL